MNLDIRLTKLEQSNKRQRIVIACLALMLFASFLIGDKLVSTTDATAQKKSQRLNELIIEDLNGEPVVVLRGGAKKGENNGIEVHGRTSVLELFDVGETKTISLGASTGDIGYTGDFRKFPRR